jgi:nitroreductase
MDFQELIRQRESCRSYDETRPVEEEKLQRILEAAQLAPSACNGQPYFMTVCKGEKAKEAAKATQGMGMNKFAVQAPVLIVISEMPYVKTAALGAKLKGNDYRSIDIGIVSAYLTAAATEEGLSTCILGWLDDEKLRNICQVQGTVRLVITLGYAKNDTIREKKRKALSELVAYKG